MVILFLKQFLRIYVHLYRSASVEGREKLMKISVCKFHKLYRNTNQVNLSLIRSYINNWAMDNSRTGCSYLLECV